MKAQTFTHIYGPVASWRLGRSLGVDPLPQHKKQCTFDCVYCQVGRQPTRSCRRAIFVPARQILDEITALPKHCAFDVITLSGNGEPTLAKNIGQIIRGIKKIRPEPVAVITNSTMLARPQVRSDIAQADIVMAKLDAATGRVLSAVNAPHTGIGIKRLINAIAGFRAGYHGVFALQIMFVAANVRDAAAIADAARRIAPDIVYINTPLRKSQAVPLGPKQLAVIAELFRARGLQTVHVYEKRRRHIVPLPSADTQKRRGKEH